LGWWVPDNIATLDTDSPPVKRNKNILEAVLFEPVTDILVHGIKLNKAVGKAHGQLTKYVSDTEKGKAWIKKNVELELKPHEELERAYVKRSDTLDELGSYNFDNATDPNAPILGYHDVYAPAESGVRTVDDFGVVGASVDAARLSFDPNSFGGRLGSIASEPAIKFMSSGFEESKIVIKGLASELKDAEDVAYRVNPNLYLSAAQIGAVGDQLANEFMGMDIKRLKKAFEFDSDSAIKSGIDADSKIGVLTSNAYNGVVKAIKGYMDEFVNMDEEKARAYLVNSVAGQVSDAAEGMRLSYGSGSIQRAQEQILDRVEFLMGQKGMTSYVRGRALRLTDVWSRLTRTASQSFDDKYKGKIIASINSEKNSTLDAIDAIMKESKETVNNLREISKSNPEMLSPLMMAYELTDGNIKSISSLNNYIKQSTSIWSKAFIDGQAEIPSVINRAFYASVYNNVLSSVATISKASFSAGHNLIEKPLRHLTASALMKDKTTFRRAMYQYSNTLESLKGSMAYAKQVFRRSAIDPNVTTLRDSTTLRNQAQMDILNATADAHAAKGDYGMQVLMENINAMNDVVDHPLSRMNTRLMQSFDGFMDSMLANFEAKGRAFDNVTQGGTLKFDEVQANKVAGGVYMEMFNADGIITDNAVRTAAGELSFTLDNLASRSTSELVRNLPILKPFMLFSKTPTNELKYAASYVPGREIVGALGQKTGILAEFTNDLNKFNLPYDEADEFYVNRLLTERGVNFTNPIEARGKYNEIRADLLGRKGLGTIFTTAGIGLALNDRLRGAGHYNRTIQKTREKADYERNTIKGLDGEWHSFENLGPLTPFLSLIGTVSDNFDILEPDDIGTVFKKLSYAFAATFKDKSTLVGIEPFIDILFNGDESALKRWGSSFISSAAVPGSSLMAELGRTFDPAALQIKDEVDAMILARIPFVKSTLPKEYDPINGGEVGVPDSLMTRMFNHYTPFKRAETMTERDQYIVDVEWSMSDVLETYEGEKLNNRQISEISNIIGEKNLFGPRLDEIMKKYPAENFRKGFKEAQNSKAELKPNAGTFADLHNEMNQAFRLAARDAMLYSPHLTSLQRAARITDINRRYMQEGDVDGAERFYQDMKQQFSK